CDPRAELLIDDIVLYDAEEARQNDQRPFPKRFLFTGWFDTGKQGKEWPGSFEIEAKPGFFWNTAKSVPHPTDKQKAIIQLDLRGDRLAGAATKLKFRYWLEGSAAMSITLGLPKRKEPVIRAFDKIPNGAVAGLDIDISAMAKGKLQKGD